MNISYQTAGNLLSGFRTLFGTGRSKSVEQSQERRQKCESQVAFFEKQKENLKNTECDTLEEIARKLEMYHSYEDQIAAAKAAYNQEQAFHTLDEAREQGEKIAEAVEKQEPKTPEERKKEAAEEAMGEEKQEGILSEIMDELTETAEELTDTAAESAQLPEAETAVKAAEAQRARAAAEPAQPLETEEAFLRRYERFDARA